MQELLIQLIVGALGGNAAGAILKKYSLGPLLNTIMGLIGGAGGSQVLDKFNINLGSDLVNNIGGSGVGGAVLLIVVGLVKSLLAKKA
ncbi:MAG: hypothetical protein JNJ83_05055 [Verrucomicrobiaceae bacterium]|nr:hypothetical protein [Verrucomicrobiaceae bacterium]